MHIFSQQAVDDLKRSIERGRAVRGPFDVQILPLDYCNLKCGFCPVEAVPEEIKRKHAPRFNTGRNKMEWPLFLKIIEGLKGLGPVERVHITGGEPMLHPDIFRMVKALKRDLGAAHVALVSNGSAIKGKAAGLVEAGLDRLSVSINSVIPDTRRILSPGEPAGTLENIGEGLKEFSSIRIGNSPGLGLSSVLTNLNYNEVEAQYLFAKKIGADSVTFIPLMGFEYGSVVSNRKLMVDEEQFNSFLADLNRFKDGALKEGVWMGYGGREDDRGTLRAPEWAKMPCYTGFAFAMFWPDGSVRPCCNCEESMGNVLRQSLSEIWHGAKYAAFRTELLRTGNPRPGCSCDECGYVIENKELHTRLSG